MRIFTQSQEQSRKRVFSSPTRFGNATPARHDHTRSIFDMARSITPQDTPPELNDGFDRMSSSPCGHDFSQIPIRPPAGSTHLVQRLTAMIPRAPVSAFSDDPTLEEEKPASVSLNTAATESETPATEPTPETEPRVEASTRETKGGETIRLPDVKGSDEPTITFSDPVNPTLTYYPYVHQITESNTCPLGRDRLRKAGLTTPLPPSIENIDVTPVLGWYFVDALIRQEVTYQVCDGVGPQGQVDISSENDPELTKENYIDVAGDLIPNSAGVPARRNYYSSDLTLRHELFHANEWATVAQNSVSEAQQWLMGKTAPTIPAVSVLMEDLSKEFMRIVGTKVAPGAEARAYADGKTEYVWRSSRIMDKGDQGMYPAWDWRTGLP